MYADKDIVFSVVAPGTALANYIASRPSASWSPRSDAGGGFPMPGLNGTLTMESPGSGTNVLEYGAIAWWDPLHRKVQFCGTSHQAGVTRFLSYSDDANLWSQGASPYPTNNPASVHAYYQNAGNPLTGDIFYSQNSPSNRAMLYSSGAWTTFTNNDPLFITGAPVVVARSWNPSMNALLSYSEWGVRKYSYTVGAPHAGSWTQLAAFSPPSVNYVNAGFYDPATGNTYFSVTPSSQTTLVRVTPAGVVTTLTGLSIPSDIHVLTSDGPHGIVVDGYTTPGGTVRKPLLIRPNVGMWEFNSSNNTYASLGIIPPVFGGDGGFFCAISTYDAILYVANDGGGNPFSYLFKR